MPSIKERIKELKEIESKKVDSSAYFDVDWVYFQSIVNPNLESDMAKYGDKAVYRLYAVIDSKGNLLSTKEYPNNKYFNK